MITIKKIEIKGFFGKGDFEWELDPVVNILGGKNGSGKSTIFKFCYMLLSGENIDQTADKKFSALFDNVVISFSNDWTLTWNKMGVGGSYTAVYSGNTPKLVRQKSVVIKDSEGNDKNLPELKELLNVFLINSFEQHVSEAIQYEQQPKSQPLDDPTMLDLMIVDQMNLRNGKFTKAMETYIDGSDESEKKRKNYVAVYMKTYEALAHFLKEYQKPFNSDFTFSKNDNTIRFEHLSMGEKQILLLILMVGNTNQQPCIFFMDEPDLSMHIDWKENLVSALHELNPNMQIILSTHAPSVITGWHDRVNEVSNLIK